MNDRTRKLATLARRYGLIGALSVGFYWLLRQAVGYRSAILFRLDIENARSSPDCGKFRWEYRMPSEAPGVLRAAAGLDWKDIESTTARGVRCFIGTTTEGAPCYFSMVSKQGFTIPDRISAEFGDARDAYVGDCLTLASYRGMGIYPCGLAELAVRLRAEGRRRLYLYVERDNLASIQGVEKAGFRRVASASIFRLGRHAARKWRPYDIAGLADWTVRLLS